MIIGEEKVFPLYYYLERRVPRHVEPCLPRLYARWELLFCSQQSSQPASQPSCPACSALLQPGQAKLTENSPGCLRKAIYWETKLGQTDHIFTLHSLPTNINQSPSQWSGQSAQAELYFLSRGGAGPEIRAIDWNFDEVWGDACGDLSL